MFEVYTYFGRVLKQFYIPDDETHHQSYEEAYHYALKYEKDTGKKCWIRLKKV